MNDVNKKIKQLADEILTNEELRAAFRSLRQRTKKVYDSRSSKGMLFFALKRATRFLGPRKARDVADLVELVGILVSTGIVLKQNVWDNPKVQEILREISNEFTTTGKKRFKDVRAYVNNFMNQDKNDRRK